MRNILILVLLSVWMAIPAQADHKVLRTVKFVWTAAQQISATPAPEDILTNHAVYLLQKGEINPDFYAPILPLPTLQVQIIRPYTEKFSVLVAGITESGHYGPLSLPSEIYSLYPNYDYDNSGCVGTPDFRTFARHYGRRISISDADGDGIVGPNDYKAFKQIYGLCLSDGEYK